MNCLTNIRRSFSLTLHLVCFLALKLSFDFYLRKKSFYTTFTQLTKSPIESHVLYMTTISFCLELTDYGLKMFESIDIELSISQVWQLVVHLVLLVSPNRSRTWLMMEKLHFAILFMFTIWHHCLYLLQN